MSTRLISFLSDIERALVEQAASTPGLSWDVTRMVSYHNNLARMTLTPVPGPDNAQVSGSILLQSFALADGSHCLNSTLTWDGSEVHRVIAVYTKTRMDWPAEAARVASAWIAGSHAPVTASPAASVTASPALTEIAS